MHVDFYIIYFPVAGIVIHYSREVQRFCDIRCAVYVLDSCHSNIHHTILLKDPSKGKHRNTNVDSLYLFLLTLFLMIPVKVELKIKILWYCWCKTKRYYRLSNGKTWIQKN